MIPEVRACSTPAPHHPARPHQPDITRERRGPGVHGWQTPPAVARNSIEQLIAGIEESMAARSHSYPLLDGFKGAYVAVTWPSTSSRFGYFKIRNRAHRMSQEGDAARVLAAMLGYLDRAASRQLVYEDVRVILMAGLS